MFLIRLYLELNHSDEDYVKARAALIEYDGVQLPSLHQIKRIVAELSGVEEMVHDMCINTCIGFTGPFSLLQHCPECNEPRYDQEVLHRTHGKVKTPRKQFVSVDKPVNRLLSASSEIMRRWTLSDERATVVYPFAQPSRKMSRSTSVSRFTVRYAMTHRLDNFVWLTGIGKNSSSNP
jgi:hypothetical protein